MPDKEERAEEIIIVRRRHDGDDHHHGGVWKIAFADFMTAMMAFFLVMWLINAANTETKASVASYFNPLKLTDSVSRKKGLLDVDEKNNSEAEPSKPERSGSKSKEASKEKEAKEKATDKKAADKKAKGKDSEKERGKSKQDDATRDHAGPAIEMGRAFRDPFAPSASSHSAVGSDAGGQVAAVSPDLAPAKVAPAAEPERPSSQTKTAAETAEASKRAGEARALLGELQQVKQRLGISGGPGIDVTIEGDNIVMSLTDTSTFGMFSVGSAEPNELLVQLMQKISPIVAAHSDRIILRGHTDARPFRADARNNNWRLAMARAEAAYAMLLRAGIEDARFERIEGHADRSLKVATDPQADANRRIEIIMRRIVR